MLDTLKGELRIFTKEFENDGKVRVVFNACVGYSTKGEDEDKEYLNYYIPVNFSSSLKKEVAKVYKQESFDVIVKEAWIKAYRDKEDKVRPILFINIATIVSSEEKPKATKKATKKAEPIDDDSLPF